MKRFQYFYYKDGIKRVDRVKNKDERRICTAKKPLGRCMDESLLGWHNCVEYMENDRLVKNIYSCTIKHTRRRSKPQKRWINSVSESVWVGLF